MKYLIAISLFLCSCCSQNMKNKIWEKQIEQREWHQKRDARIDSMNYEFMKRKMLQTGEK